MKPRRLYPDILAMLLFANVPFAEADAIAREMSR